MADEVEKSAGRWLRRITLLLVVFGGVAAWYFTLGHVTVNPGEHAVVLRLGEHVRTVKTDGLHVLTFPQPIETVAKIRVQESLRREFGDVDATDAAKLAETAMQTRDNNIILTEFVVQYRLRDAFNVLYRVADLDDLLGDASQAAMREVVGRSTADAIIAEQKDLIGQEVGELLQRILDTYEAGIEIERVAIQDVQPPTGVREAFDDVLAASQDRSRLVNEAEAYANEVLPRARGEAAELIASADGYRAAKVADAEGEAQRFSSLLAEYEKAPEITRKRLYLETMEEILPNVDKVIVEPGGTPVLPYLPLGTQRGRAEVVQ
jgi:membrane protease subunit HflK